MIRKSDSAILLVFLCLLLANCGGLPSTSSGLGTPSPKVTVTKIIGIASGTPTAIATATPEMRAANIVITPEDVFNNVALEPVAATGAVDLCKQVPIPKLTRGNNALSGMGGRFALCALRDDVSAFDLDSGLLVSSADVTADLHLGASQATLDGTVTYYLDALNNARIDDVDSGRITYKLCEDAMRSLSRPGIFIIETDAFACIQTTEDQISLIRVESVDTFGVESVELSFVILKK